MVNKTQNQLSGLYHNVKDAYYGLARKAASLALAATFAIPFAGQLLRADLVPSAHADEFRVWETVVDTPLNLESATTLLYTADGFKIGAEHHTDSDTSTGALDLKLNDLTLKAVASDTAGDSSPVFKLLYSPIRQLTIVAGHADLPDSDAAFGGVQFRDGVYGFDALINRQGGKDEFRGDAFIFFDPVFLGYAHRNSSDTYVVSMPNDHGPVFKAFFTRGRCSDLRIYGVDASLDSTGVDALTLGDSIGMLDDDLMGNDAEFIASNPFRYIVPEMDQRGKDLCLRFRYISPSEGTRDVSGEVLKFVRGRFWLGASYSDVRDPDSHTRSAGLIGGYTRDDLQVRLELSQDLDSGDINSAIRLEKRFKF
ncbi:hypothetical protein JW968_05645 [Candidatus Woesearchaeota archaeon]|nr:hypothetical protein [Candidatus Woesearchaeota archaeon]